MGGWVRDLRKPRPDNNDDWEGKNTHKLCGRDRHALKRGFSGNRSARMCCGGGVGSERKVSCGERVYTSFHSVK
jgi:hypothetical protein